MCLFCLSLFAYSSQLFSSWLYLQTNQVLRGRDMSEEKAGREAELVYLGSPQLRVS